MEPEQVEGAWIESLNKLSEMLNKHIDGLRVAIRNHNSAHKTFHADQLKWLIDGAKKSWKKSKKLEHDPPISAARKNLYEHIQRANETLDRALGQNPTVLQRLLRWLQW